MFISEKATWYRPTTLKQLLELNTTHPDAKLIGGNYEQSGSFSWLSVTASLSLGCQYFIYFLHIACYSILCNNQHKSDVAVN